MCIKRMHSQEARRQKAFLVDLPIFALLCHPAQPLGYFTWQSFCGFSSRDALDTLTCCGWLILLPGYEASAQDSGVWLSKMKWNIL